MPNIKKSTTGKGSIKRIPRKLNTGWSFVIPAKLVFESDLKEPSARAPETANNRDHHHYSSCEGCYTMANRSEINEKGHTAVVFALEFIHPYYSGLCPLNYPSLNINFTATPGMQQ